MKITYHSWKTFSECPKKHNLEYVQKQPSLVPINEYHTLYGKLVEMFFEMFCNIWRHETSYMPPDMIRNKLTLLYDQILQNSTVKWSGIGIHHTKDEIFEQAFHDVCIIMDSHNQNYFLNTRSEVTITVDLKNDNRLEGRIDFIHKSPIGNDISIFDGKGTDKIGKNISNNQLLFYAMLYYFRYNVLPVELGFFYFKHNSYVPIFFNDMVLNEFRSKLALDIKLMVTPEACDRATPSYKACRYCKYQPGCQEYITAKVSRAKKSKIDDMGDGIINFGF